MGKRILIFDTEVNGHHIEYIHHLLKKANSSNDEYIFYLPKQFEERKGNNLNWNYKENISFYFFNHDDGLEQNSMLVSSYKRCKILKQAVERFEVSHVFLITLISFIPFLPFFISNKINVSGIIYQIYLYRWKGSSFLKKILDVCKYIILSYSKSIKQIYILNDAASARKFNQLYNTDKFTFLIDPYVPINEDSVNLDFLNIKEGNTVYFHFGALVKRKGTLDILKAIKLVNTECLYKTTFIFAGKVNNEIKNEFYNLLNDIKKMNNCQLIVLDKFCDYGLIAELCKRADILLMPYKVVSHSSGVIGYAAQYNTPVLAPSGGLIGKLVRKYKLGYTLEKVTPENIAEFINKGILCKKTVPTEYLKVNNVDNFINMITFK